MSGFLGGLKRKAMTMASGEEALAGVLGLMLESPSGGQDGMEQLYKQFDKAGPGDKARS